MCLSRSDNKLLVRFFLFGALAIRRGGDYSVKLKLSVSLVCDLLVGQGHFWGTGLGATGGWVARGHGVGLFAFGGAYWPIATAHSDPLRVRTCFGSINRAAPPPPPPVRVRGGVHSTILTVFEVLAVPQTE